MNIRKAAKDKEMFIIFFIKFTSINESYRV